MIEVFLLSQRNNLPEAIKDVFGYPLDKQYKIKKNLYLFIYKFLSGEDALSFIKKIYSNVLAVYINRYFIINNCTNSLSNILKLNLNKLRVIVFPKLLEEKILENMESKGIELSPTKFQQILFVVNVENKYYYGVFPREYFVKKKEFKAINRSYYKIAEAIDRFKIPIDPNWKVLDIGAAPGGWSEYLSERVKLIIAVDPAELKIKKNNIVHIKKKIEDCLEELEKYKPFNLVTCDMNQDPREVAKILIDLSSFLDKEAYIIMTVKLIYKSKKARERLIKRTLEILRKRYEILDIKKLVSNHEEVTLALRKTSI